MELIDIIRTSLIIFSLISSIVFAASYLIYKLRHRNGSRVYIKSNEFIAPVVLLKPVDIKEPAEPEVKKQNPRFQVLNQGLTSDHSAQASLPIHKIRQKPVISYYSFNNNEPLHKFRTARVSVE